MNTFALLLLGVAVVNPPRVRLLLGARSARIRMRAAAGGSVVAVGAAVVLAALAHPLIDALDIAPETFRVASAMVITLTALVVIATQPGDGELLRGAPRDALVPVAYPLLTGPGAVMAWLVLGVDRGVWTVLGVAAAACALVTVLSPLPAGRRSTWVGAARLLAAGAVVLGVALVIDGVREV